VRQSFVPLGKNVGENYFFVGRKPVFGPMGFFDSHGRTTLTWIELAMLVSKKPVHPFRTE